MGEVGSVLAIYQQHTDQVKQAGATLWADLDVGTLLAGVEGVQAGLKKLSALKLLPVYQAVEKEVAAFGESLPLMKELKNEALR